MDAYIHLVVFLHRVHRVTTLLERERTALCGFPFTPLINSDVSSTLRSLSLIPWLQSQVVISAKINVNSETALHVVYR